MKTVIVISKINIITVAGCVLADEHILLPQWKTNMFDHVSSPGQQLHHHRRVLNESNHKQGYVRTNHGMLNLVRAGPLRAQIGSDRPPSTQTCLGMPLPDQPSPGRPACYRRLQLLRSSCPQRSWPRLLQTWLRWQPIVHCGRGAGQE